MKPVHRALLAALALVAANASAQPYPAKPIRLIVPYQAGGLPDTVARIVGQAAGEGLGQSIIVDNRPGSAGVVAIDIAMRAPADGYTLLIADSAHYAISPHLVAKLPYDMLRDFVPVGLTTNSAMHLVVNTSTGAQSLQEFVALAREKPGMPFGSSGYGSAHHLTLECLMSAAKISFTHIPYKGTGQSLPAVVAGDVAAIFGALNNVAPHAKAGKIRVLGAAAARRSALNPDIPTLTELGVPGCEAVISVGIFAPSKTPRDVVERLNAELVKVLARADVQGRIAQTGGEPASSSPDELAQLIRSELDFIGKLVQRAGIKATP